MSMFTPLVTLYALDISLKIVDEDEISRALIDRKPTTSDCRNLNAADKTKNRAVLASANLQVPSSATVALALDRDPAVVSRRWKMQNWNLIQGYQGMTA